MSDWFFWLPAVVAAMALASWLVLWSYGRFARLARGAPSQAIPGGQGAALDRLIDLAQDRAGLSFDAAEALAIRLASARMAERSVDVMTYIWSGDRSGRMLADTLAEAAGRGVRVRILLDDVNLWGRDPPWLALNRVDGVEVRIFNPVRTRRGGLTRGLEMLLLALRYNRRMHGKLWMVDGRLALLGGRNVGDVYFGLARGRRRNVLDADILLAGGAAGGIVAEASGLFDEFWNSGLALPIASLWRGQFPARLSVARNRAKRVDNGITRSASDQAVLVEALGQCRSSRRLKLIADPPEKALGLRPGPRGGRGWLPDHLVPAMASASRKLTVATPYLVPGRAGLEELSSLAERGVSVTVLTNALAVIDHAIVHGAYRWYRPRLLAAGIRLFEFGSPEADRRNEMMHAKLALIDDELGFVGSFNFDLRSTWLNTELGVLFDDPGLIEKCRNFLDESMAPARSYRVERAGRWTIWHKGNGQKLHFEPGTTLGRRVLAFVVGHLPIHRLL